MKAQLRQFFRLFGIVTLIFAVTSCDQKVASVPTPEKKAPIANKKIVPDLKGMKLGDTMEQVLKLAYDEGAYNTKRAIESGDEYLVSVTEKEGSRIATVGGTSATITLEFLKGVNTESSILYCISAVFSAGAYDVVLKGLTDKYGESQQYGSGESRSWSFYDGRYTVNLRIREKENSDTAFLFIVDTQVFRALVEKQTKEGEQKKVLDAKDL